jgi:branched-chain amino acid transport system substrate-binding protein
MNENKMPQLFIFSATSKFNDPKLFPWTTPWFVVDRIEGAIYGRYIRTNLPDSKIAVLYQNDDFGKGKLIGLREGLGDNADNMIVST